MPVISTNSYKCWATSLTAVETYILVNGSPLEGTIYLCSHVSYTSPNLVHYVSYTGRAPQCEV